MSRKVPAAQGSLLTGARCGQGSRCNRVVWCQGGDRNAQLRSRFWFLDPVVTQVPFRGLVTRILQGLALLGEIC